ncbi:MAG: S-layer homology domain-containing protein [bacterium]|nr:S-layer homology domain-containing protein [bacterium]
MKKYIITLAIVLLNTNIAFADSILSPIVKIAQGGGYDLQTTGLIINEDGYILTTSDNITHSGNKYTYLDEIDICPIETDKAIVPNCVLKAETIIALPSLNLGILKITNKGDFEFDFEMPKFKQYSPKIKDEISIEGFGYERYEFTGVMRQLGDESLTRMDDSILERENGQIIATENLSDNTNWYFLTDTPVNLGNSGSPVYDTENNLIGLSSSYGNEDDNMYYLIPPSTGNSVGYVISNDIILFFMLSMTEAKIIDLTLVESLFSTDHIEAIQAEDANINIQILSDVDLLSTYAQAISYLKDHKIISGYEDGTFRPDNPLNRAELLKILVEAKGESPKSSTYKNCFPDVKTDWYAKYVCFAESKGWIKGYPDGNFKPENYVNKAEAIKMLMNTFELYQWRNEGSGGFDGYPYLDVKVGEWYMQYIEQAKEIGLLEEADGYFLPGELITRGQISENIFRLLIVLISNPS